MQMKRLESVKGISGIAPFIAVVNVKTTNIPDVVSIRGRKKMKISGSCVAIYVVRYHMCVCFLAICSSTNKVRVVIIRRPTERPWPALRVIGTYTLLTTDHVITELVRINNKKKEKYTNYKEWPTFSSVRLVQRESRRCPPRVCARPFITRFMNRFFFSLSLSFLNGVPSVNVMDRYSLHHQHNGVENHIPLQFDIF